jgi:gliding motility-associated-like protein
VDLGGTTGLPNSVANVVISDAAFSNTIGGATTATRNIIGGNTPNQVIINGAGTDTNHVKGNYIGVGLDQNTTYTSNIGVQINNGPEFNFIGGGVSGEGNYLPTFNSHAIFLQQNANKTRIAGNTIGLTPSGSNGSIQLAAIRLEGADAAQIGGVLVGTDSANVITNAARGVVLANFFANSSYGNAIIGNSIYGITGQAIDIDDNNTVEPIDGLVNLGNNGKIDIPEILTAWNCSTTHIGVKTNNPNLLAGYGIEFYQVSAPGFLGYGEGETYLGRLVFTPDTQPDTIDFDLGVTLPVGTFITATFTGTLLNTSEFSEAFAVTAAPTFSAPTVVDETCLGANNGTVVATAPGATVFSTDGGSTLMAGIGGISLSLPTGSFNLDAYYLNGCIQTQPIVLNPGPALPFDYVVLPDTCGNNFGSIEIDIAPTDLAGGSGTYNYTFSNGAAYLTSIDTTGLTTGNYLVGLYDPGLGCYSDTISINVPEINDVVDESFVFDDFCPGSPAFPTSFATGGGDWTFNPLPGDGAVIDMVTGEITASVPGNSYSVEYTVGICAEVSNVTVLAATIDDPSFTYDAFCVGSAPVISTSTPGGTWQFDTAPTSGSIDPSTGEITGPADTYQVEYITAGTCPDSSVVSVVAFDTPAAPTIVSGDTIYCPDEAIQSMTTTMTTGPTYNWYDDPALTNLLGTGVPFTPTTLNTGSNFFYVTATDAGNGCVSLPDSMDYILVDVSAMQAGPDEEVCIGSQLQLTADGGVNYLWSGSTQITDDLDTEDPMATISSPEEFIVQIEDSLGCIVMDTLSVTMLDPANCNIEIYNAFSPNSDGTNDFWVIEGIEGFPENQVYIYNRWGDLMKYIENYNNVDIVWDGTNKNGNPVSTSTYFYVVEVGGEQNQSGWVHVMK